MHRMFTSFPAGRAGAALVLARLSLGASVVFDSWNRSVGADACLWNSAVTAMALCIGAGFLTPFAAIASASAELIVLSNHGNPMTAALAAHCVAMSLLGPGAYSVDSCIYGKKVLVWPRR
jgi:fluoride ion exporter CrcB/FEX